MKGTFLKKLGALALSVCTTFGALAVVGCNGDTPPEETDLQVYVPDGAPALSIAMMMAEDTESDGYDYHVVQASEISLKVTGETDLADFAILPVNMASLLLSDGQTYQLIGSVTQGNLFLCSKTETEWIDQNNVADSLKGKTVGVVQYQAFPGLAFRATLKKLGVNYHVVTESTPDKMQNLVNLQAITPTQIGDAGIDYYLAFEPNLSRALSVPAKGLTLVSDVQMLYGGGGYPQAVLVAKRSLIDDDPALVRAFMSKMELADDWLLSANAESLYNAVQNHANGFTVAFTAADLSLSTRNRCSVRFQKTTACKNKVEAFLSELKGVDATVKLTSENFFAIL